MRQFSFIVLAAAFISVGCSHTSKKADAPAAPETKSAAKSEDKDAAQTQKSTSGTKVECSVKGDARILEVRGKNAGCELAYTKAGKEGIVASASHGTSYCDKAFEKLRDKLKGSGYDCK